MKWMMLTIGGSDVPIVRSITTYKPDRVVFICSGGQGDGKKGSYTCITGAGSVCNDGRPNIPTQAGLRPEQYELSVYDVDPDDISQCYAKINERIKAIRDADPDAVISCDYTGGTKSMSVALVLAAVDDGKVDIKLVSGQRTDLIKVRNGTESLRRANLQSVALERLQKQVNAMLEHYEYSAAEEILSQYSADSQIDRRIDECITLCRAFDAWDRFDHELARNDLEFLNGTKYGEYLRFLRSLPRGVEPAWKDQKGRFLVADILANAERRASQGRYDDAIARHYRAIELLAQTLLWNRYQIDSGDVKAESVPDQMGWKSKISEWSAQLGLIRSWDLLAALDKDVDALWVESKERVKDSTLKRNSSILAHGTARISKDDYGKDLSEGMGWFVRQAMDKLRMSVQVPVFPKTMLLEND